MDGWTNKQEQKDKRKACVLNANVNHIYQLNYESSESKAQQ